ncbi:hypothetical protein AArcSl_2952 [Halalkaliarchaeum desulfuricum]|uniref:6-hydroxymethylpterin diphosphokinase MptE-like domain-containing protein n=1 Tax=Halalkaliarchaeum desulfuricum TaxID=2055893 RepID=A0A343TN91_9EURY|nr:6-hydroxymethylpterin diphosphokinase MptE-like protein [Halalkaliarchaeum desulfuricum]AUX10563.1 hypothetical protein AArcSl_2952 [Halalkaliarchaeum desulfuricum]
MTENKVGDYEDIHSGERVFIVGNGPSLAKTPLKQLQDEYTIATNKIYKIYDSTEWRPDYYLLSSMTDDIKTNDMSNVVGYSTTCFINSKRQEILSEYKGTIPIDVCHPDNDPLIECFDNVSIPNEARSYWSDQLSDYVYLYNSSIYPLYQMAYYMGFEKIILIGCDLGMDIDYLLFEDSGDPIKFLNNNLSDYSGEYPLSIYSEFIRNSDHPIKSILNLAAVEIGNQHLLFASGSNPYSYKRNNRGKYDSTSLLYLHFILESNNKLLSFFNGLYGWFTSHIPRLLSAKDPHFDGYGTSTIMIGEDDRQRRAHLLARDKLMEREAQIYNATIGGELEIHPRIDFESVIDSD